MRVLITNNTLAARAGSEVYARDVAIGLLRRGHTPIAYSTQLGLVAEELRRATVPVVDSLDLLSEPPDIIHGQHHLETMTALLHFSGVPAIYFCLGWLPWEEKPPRFPRIKHYVAVDDVCRDRLVYEEGIPATQVSIIGNSIDLNVFRTRPPLPERPVRALVYSNYAVEGIHLRTIRTACERFGITLDVVGLRNGNPSGAPEKLLRHYDIVFAKGRCAFEAMAVGAAVIVCDQEGVGPMVTAGEFDKLRRLNFGLRAQCNAADPDVIAKELARYEARDCAEVTRRVRASSGAETALDDLVSLYEQVIAEYRNCNGEKLDSEGRAAADYLRTLKTRILQDQDAIYNTTAYRLGNFLVRMPAARLVKRLCKSRFSTRSY